MLDFVQMLSDNVNKATVKGDGVFIAIFDQFNQRAINH